MEGQVFYQVSRMVGLGAALVLGLVAERWRPHRPLDRAWRTNLGLWGIDALVIAGTCGACGWLAAGHAAERGIGLLRWIGCGGWVAVALSVPALDAVSYFWHRANHRVRLLWRFHRVHHSDTGFDVSTSLRFHPGELLLSLPLRLAAVIVLGAPPEGVLAFELLFGAANVLEHGNFDLPDRLDASLQRVVITPALHRKHHTREWRELDANFGTVLSIWDRLAGTFRAADSAQVVTGLPDWREPQPPSLAQSLLLPLGSGGQRSGS